MHDLEVATPDGVRAGLVASVASICWTVTASAFVITLGLRSGSTVLVAFGSVGIFDGAGSAALVAHFRHALQHESISARREWFAHLVIVMGLLIVGAGTSIASGIRLLTHAHTREPFLGTLVSAASVFALGCLAARKHGVAQRIPSRALLADSWLSAAGCITALMAVIGTELNAAFGWWWVDPAAALCVAVGAIGIGLGNVRHLREPSPPEQ